MPRHNHEYKEFSYESYCCFDIPNFGNYGFFAHNTKEYGGKFSYTSSTTSVGGGSSHNNMPPFLTANCWKRTG